MEELSIKLKQERGNRGVREVAAEIGIGHATLSRIESGKQPDLLTFTKICKWLEVDPNTFLGFDKNSAINPNSQPVAAHFRAEKTMRPKTAQHLAELILAVQKAEIEKTPA